LFQCGLLLARQGHQRTLLWQKKIMKKGKESAAGKLNFAKQQYTVKNMYYLKRQ